ncbi:MAG: glycosyltransferase, partial [Promicromonosporaceae bacterium]|nr:glycosyltransferase [Promicromonosporaceae bacterium]
MSANHVPPAPRPGVVSVVLVNFRGAADTNTCLSALKEVDWPADALELIVVENGSGDDSAAVIKAAHPDVMLVESETNRGFAGGCNLGVAHASGQWVAFLNNDARPAPGWIRAAVDELASDPAIGAVASKVLDWDGQKIDYVDGAMSWFGMGYKREVLQPDSPAFDQPKDVLFATGAAMFVPTALFREVGGFDERFFMFFEDVDLGWRLNLLGYRVRYVPGSLAYHKHHASIAKFGEYREVYLLERNALLTIYKNLDDESLAKALPAALALAVRRGVARDGLDTSSFEIAGGKDDSAETITVNKLGLTGAYAVDQFVTEMTRGLTEVRADLQGRRRRTDREIFPLFRDAMAAHGNAPHYLAAYEVLTAAFDIVDHFQARQRILIVTDDALTAKMAGPAIRSWQIATAVAPFAEVRLVSTVVAEIASDDFEVASAIGSRLRAHTDWADVVIFQGFLLDKAPWLKRSDKILVADIYDPMHLEQLEQARDLGPEVRAHVVADTTRVLNEQIRRADFMLCASEKQRDFWLGQLASQGRINQFVYDEDHSLDSLLAVVPFGISDDPPVQTAHGIKGVVPGISQDDKVIIWGGGVYNWFDPLTLVRAVARLAETHADVRLFFLGFKHPNPHVPHMRMATELFALSDELGLTDRHVFFNSDWVPYEQRANWLLDADVGVSTHFHHVETAFSFRTRILDYLWAGLPIVATGGDTFDALITERGLGATVPEQDVDALAAALEKYLYDDEAVASAKRAIVEFAEGYRWAKVLEPLVEFCRQPRRAADLALGYVGQEPDESAQERRPSKDSRLASDVRVLREYLRNGGVGEVA